MLEQYYGYRPPIPDDLRERYEQELTNVLRWKNGNWRENIYENNWQHVSGMFSILNTVTVSSNTLSSDIDIPTVQDMIYAHDLGEILGGDLTHNREDYNEIRNRWKKREFLLGLHLLKRIEDPDIRKQAKDLYRRCFYPQDYDKEALLTEFIDKLQGSDFGFNNVFHGKGMTQAAKQSQFNRTFGLLTTPLTPLFSLVSEDTRVDLTNYLLQKLESFATFGYKKEAAPYITAVRRGSFVIQ
jgi:5'-deoxynucleotidase YfbR-like HD superfamily hydrolase